MKIAAVILSIATLAAATRAADPLPSWNETAPERAIMKFVERVATQDSPDFVPVPGRIAVFGNDGCLWSEQPMYFQAFSILDRIRQLAPEHPEWNEKEPFASVLKGDVNSALAGGEHALIEMAMATHAGLTSEEFNKIIADWLASAKHPKTGKLNTDMVFQPMLELLA
jgi:hypothetical protein